MECHFYKKGKCAKGTSCKFLHLDPPQVSLHLDLFNKYHTPSQPPPPPAKKQHQKQHPPPTCNKCGKVGHIRKECKFCTNCLKVHDLPSRECQSCWICAPNYKHFNKGSHRTNQHPNVRISKPTYDPDLPGGGSYWRDRHLIRENFLKSVEKVRGKKEKYREILANMGKQPKWTHETPHRSDLDSMVSSVFDKKMIREGIEQYNYEFERSNYKHQDIQSPYQCEGCGGSSCFGSCDQ
ncbi:hypothetical protein CYY_001693 [Polysphondylium violaceum]|uniref:Uncharacterized protein n=1 Tax=Polysphondylium violaceum TaxID=133409 RepID=A0A8J4Q1C4_9MYCE|nr:hypothetical protein CYY_001693 [Polysphondylium violaceum]